MPERTPESPGDNPNLQRLQKIIAAAGIASRRKAEELIIEGRVQVNGQVVAELGAKADPAKDHIRVDGKLLQGSEKHRYFVLNKPKGYVTTVSDPEGRPTVMKFFDQARARIYPVGRLDYQSEGLLLLTNDGELANQLTRASSKVEKTYLVKISGKPSESALAQIRAGIMIDRGKPGTREGRVLTQPARVTLVRDADNPWYEVVLTEGRNRQIRKLFEEIGHFVEKIRRVGYGPLVLDLPPGEFRELTPKEVLTLQHASRIGMRTRQGVSNPLASAASPKKLDRLVGPRPAKKTAGGRTGAPRPGSKGRKSAFGSKRKPGGPRPSSRG